MSHLLKFVRAWGSVRSILTHDRCAYCGVLSKDGHVEPGLGFSKRNQIFFKRLKRPLNPGAQGLKVHAFDDREIFQKQITVLGSIRGDAKATVASNHRCYTKAARG